VGYALGLAYQGKWDRVAAAAKIPEPNEHFQALVGLAELALDKSPDEVKKYMTEAFDVYERGGALNVFWTMRQLASVGARAGLADQVEKFLEKLPANSLKSEALLAAYRGRSGNASANLDALNNEATKKTHAYPRLVAFLSRNAAYQGSASSVEKSADRWEPESLRPLGYMGAALGMQDAGARSQQIAHGK
jgi:hypothetical protein